MSRSRNHEWSRKSIDEVRAFVHRQAILRKNASRELDIVAIREELSDRSTIYRILGAERRNPARTNNLVYQHVRVTFTPDGTAHVFFRPSRRPWLSVS